MKRHNLAPRKDWQQILEKQGCYYHTIDGKPYWNESAAYEFTAAEIDQIENATQELHQMCKQHVQDVVDSGDYYGYNFDDATKELIEKSWNSDHPSLLGRFDFGFNAETRQLKMFEYNADTPTSLPEASIFQWDWLQSQKIAGADQFNSIHEKLVEELQAFVPTDKEPKQGRLYFAGSQNTEHEDWGNLHYLVQCAIDAGNEATAIPLDQIGWSDDANCFCDMANKEIGWIFKLYPWEWMMREDYAAYIPVSTTLFVEPPWKMLLSTKALLPALWSRYVGHPNLLESMPDDDRNVMQYVRKPMYGREGSNISFVTFKRESFAPKNSPVVDKYANDGHILQQAFTVTKFGDKLPVIGSWVIGDKPAGIGIREEAGITTNASQFVPHFFK